MEPTGLYERNCVVGNVSTANSAGSTNLVFIQSKDVFGNNLTTAVGFENGPEDLKVKAHQNWCASGWEGAFCQIDEDECEFVRKASGELSPYECGKVLTL